MVIQCIHMVFEKEMVENQVFLSQIKFTKAKNISIQIQLSSNCKYN